MGLIKNQTVHFFDCVFNLSIYLKNGALDNDCAF
mgnify:CR=1 FL=1